MSNGAIVGLDGLLNLTKNFGGNSDFVKELWLRDGETAKLRFLTEYTEVVSGNYHVVMNSKGNRRDKWCKAQDGLDCEECVTQVPKSLRFNLFVYVYYVDRTSPGTGRTPRQVGNLTVYRENRNEVMLLHRGVGHMSTYAAELKSYYNKFGTLLDRDYEWTRMGANKENTTYRFIPESPSEFGAKASFPCSLEDVVRSYPFLPAKKEETQQEFKPELAVQDQPVVDEEPPKGEPEEVEQGVVEDVQDDSNTEDLLDKLFG